MANRLADYQSFGADSLATQRDTSSGASATNPRPFIRGSDVQGFVQPAENLILRYPGAALAAAFFVGVLVAWWIKRK